MAWVKSGTETLTSATTSITLTGLGSNDFYTCFCHIVSGVGNSQAELQFGNGGLEGSGYLFQQDKNGTEASASANTSVFKMHNTSAQQDKFYVSYIANPSTEEKLFIGYLVDSNGTGNTNPNRTINFGKLAYTSNQIDQIKNQSSNLQDGTNLTALGSDGVESMTVQDGAIFYETDTNKEYLLSNNTWTEV